MSSSPHPPINHVFVDLENVRRIDPEVLGRLRFAMTVFLGPQNKKLDVDVVESLLGHSEEVKLIRSPKPGKNALDFVLVYHLGQAVQAHPKGFFHIISKDAGFDSLVELLRQRQVKVQRHDGWDDLDATLSPTRAAKLSDAATKMLENLMRSPRNRPKQRKTLVNHAVQIVGKEAGLPAQERLVAELEKAGSLAFDDKGKVTYQL